MFTKPYCFGKLDLSNQSKSAGRASPPLGCNIEQLIAQRGSVMQKSLSLILSFVLQQSELSPAEPTSLQVNLTLLKRSLHSMSPLLFTWHVLRSPRVHWLLLEVKIVGMFKEKNMREFLKFTFFCFPSMLNLIVVFIIWPAKSLLLVVTNERKEPKLVLKILGWKLWNK